MKRHFLKIVLPFFTLLFFSCSDPIFYTISLERKPLPPKISGSPTNFVVFNNKMYVASGTILYIYSGTKSGDASLDNWDEVTLPGKILQLAATDNNLFALCEEAGVRRLRSLSDNWGTPPGNNIGNNNIYSIYAAGPQLFIGGGSVGSFFIRLHGSDQTQSTGNNRINGIAFDGTNYYLSANDIERNGGCIYIFDGAGSLNKIREGISFMGIINLGNNDIAAIARDGALYKVTSGSVDTTGHSIGGGKLATGALAVWTDNNGNRLLLAGRQDEMKNSVNYVYGYLELELDSGGIKNGTAFREPGWGDFSSINVGDNGIYTSTIGKQPVNFIFQAPSIIDSKMTLFASTQKRGVWSYRNRGREGNPDWHWNAEQ